MISKAKLKYIKSLQIKKFRRINGEFLVEGAKSVLELLHSGFSVSSLFITKEYLDKYGSQLTSFKGELNVVSPQELSSVGSFETNNSALAIVKMKENHPLYIEKDEYIIALDEVKDPGNLGTIIRIADWYGIKKIICSEESAELYNPKVIGSSMGSFTRVSLFYTNLKEYFLREQQPVFGAFLDGVPVSQAAFPKRGILLMGNESVGIHEELTSFVSQRITIPGTGKAESLNVAVATAIICDRLINR